MSVTAAVIVMIAMGCVYAGVIFLSRSYNPGGRDPVNALYAVSQWSATRWELTGTCVVPTAPGNCVIEGMTGAHQASSQWCDRPDGACIDPDSGSNTKTNPVPMQVTCASIPYCSWSKCLLTFDGLTYVQVIFSGGSATLSTSADTSIATPFFMNRLAVEKGLINSQNGTIAKFYMLGGDGNTYILSYSNTVNPVASSSEQATMLTIRRTDSAGGVFLTMFVLMETMPTDVSGTSGGPPPGIVARKILAFGGANRTNDPSLTELSDFNDHVQSKMWNSASQYQLTMIRYRTDYSIHGFYGVTLETYTRVLDSWRNNTLHTVLQDAVEERLSLESKGSLNRAFYSWFG